MKEEILQLPRIFLFKKNNPEVKEDDKFYYTVESEGIQQNQLTRLYVDEDYDKVQERFNHIQKIGVKNYLQEIQIQTELLYEEVVNYPELIDQIKEQYAKRQKDAVVVDDEGNSTLEEVVDED